MPLPVLDLSQPDNVRRELLDDDRPVREEFAAALDQEFSELAEALAACFARLPEVHAAAARAPTPPTSLSRRSCSGCWTTSWCLPSCCWRQGRGRQQRDAPGD